MYGQEAENFEQRVQDAVDNRGVIAPTFAEQLRKVRSAEEWQRYDSIVIGEGAGARDAGWFNTWNDLANASEMQWFTGRSSAVGLSYSNQTTERTDWAQDLHMSSIEFIAPAGMSEYEENSLEADYVPTWFVQQLPNQLGIRIVLSDSDEIAKAPASHFPARYGTAYPAIAGAAGPVTMPGTSGQPNVANGWRWPVPIMLAAKARITCNGRVDQPSLDLLRQLPDPGAKLLPTPSGAIVRVPNWYTIRFTHSGPRYLQLRGARTSA